MSNSIDSSMVSKPLVSPRAKTAVTTDSQAPLAASKPATDKAAVEKPAVSLSSVSADMSAPVNSARVQALQAQIADGSYQPNPEAIANAMIQMDRELFP